jgi:ligand-binding sensor domain-containing protein
MHRNLLTLFIVLILCTNCCYGQDLYFQSYSSAQGLSQNSVYSIAQTREGFMWFGTQDGLNRFDGRNFTTIRPINTKTDSGSVIVQSYSKMITALLADSKDRLWTGTTQGLSIYDRYTSRFILPQRVYKGFVLPEKLYINKIIEDKLGRIWITANDNGLFCYSIPLQKMVRFYWPDTRPLNITALTIDSAQNIWASTEQEIYKLDQAAFKSIDIGKKITGNKILILDVLAVKNDLWIIEKAKGIMILQPLPGSNYSLSLFTQQYKGQKYLADAKVIHQSDSNTLWIGSRSEGLIKVNLALKKFENAGASSTGYSLKSQFVLSFFTNQQKITWIGLSGGIGKYDMQKVQFSLWRNEPEANKPMPENKLLSVFSDNDEDFYSGTLSSGILYRNIKTGVHKYYQPPLTYYWESDSKNIYEIIDDENKTVLWLCTWGGLYSFNKLTKKFIQYIDPENEQTKQLCSVIALKKQHSLLTGGYKNGLVLFNLDTKKWEPCKDKNGILKSPNLRVRYMKEIEDGIVYMSTEAQNLVKYNYLTGEFTFFPELQKISGTSRYFSRDSQYCWIATDDGLIQAAAATMKIIKIWNTDNGLPNNVVYAVVPDDFGRIWISTNNGLALIDYKANTCKIFTENDGLQSAEFNTAACYKDKKGRIWLGGINGLNMVAPQLTVSNDYSPSPLLTKILVMNSPLQIDSAVSYIHAVKLPYNQNFISLEFQSPNFSQTENIEYSYMLEGVDTGWVNNGNRNFVNYTQLKPGNYTFKVKCFNNNYIWSDINTLQITITPPWFKTWWFYLVSALCIVTLLFLFYKQRVKTISYKAGVKQKITETEMAALKAQMNPHFMFNCINSIDAFIHSNDKYNATLYLNKFAKLLRNILDSSKANTVSITKDIETLKLYIELEELRNENKFKTTFTVDEELLTNDYKVPPLIIQPFVENAILHGIKNKYENDGILTVEIKRVNDKIQYTVTDNGVGRNAAAKIMQNKESHYGMQMSYDRIKLFNKEETASVQVNDLYNNEKAAGTKVIVNLNII